MGGSVMYTVRARNVAQALPIGVRMLLSEGVREQTRGGEVLVAPGPVVTVYGRPEERVLFSPVRDANPFFHLMEALWMLAGRRDAKFLDRWVSTFSERFGEPDNQFNQHGAYGYRWMHWFEHPDGCSDLDQISMLVEVLKKDPTTRQAVLAMWDPSTDLGTRVLRDRPCNTHIYFRVQRGPVDTTGDHAGAVLDMTVCCRSNDIIWGAYGANAVHMSILQEYVATMVGVGVGTYYQFSNNYHMYTSEVERLDARTQEAEPHRGWAGLPSALEDDRYAQGVGMPVPLVADPATFDVELVAFLNWVEFPGAVQTKTNPFLWRTALPMVAAHLCWKHGLPTADTLDAIESPDWRVACTEWLQRRMK